ncbi:SHOCT domain-containing protein [Arthrobacter rhombi]|uniref:SHOCT domain-containing protein n=1 Tax=Arthrobacter rhombi TaxID=71253 RepID=UPI003FCEEAE4
MEALIGILMLGLLIAAVFQKSAYDQKRRNQKNDSDLEAIDKLGISATPLSLITDTAVLVSDGDSGRVYFTARPFNNKLELTQENLTSVEVVEDDHILIRSTRLGQVGGGLAGGALAGSAGAVIGGLGAKKSSEELVRDVILRVVIQGTPIDMPLLDAGKEGVSRASVEYSMAVTQANEWCQRLTRKISPEEQATGQQSSLEDGRASTKIDSLEKLVRLRESGYLTDEEFRVQKSRLLKPDEDNLSPNE